MPKSPGHTVRKALRVGLAIAAIAAPAFAAAPGEFGVDAPELARRGELAVGVRTLSFVQSAQADLAGFEAGRGAPPLRDRKLTVDLWYPARRVAGAAPEVYRASLPSESPAAPAEFKLYGTAVRGAPRAGGNYPLVIISPGYSNPTAALIWLTENLASKGYVVAAIRHTDPPITDRTGFPQLLLRRPLDIGFVARTLQKTLAAERLIDPTRTALIGYSMGGYGVLTAAGATLDPASPAVKMVPAGLLLPYARGGASREAVKVSGLRAVVAMAPVGGGGLAAWGPDGLRSITTPLLLIAGDHDLTVNYATGARVLFDLATGAQRYLLTFQGAGHAIGLGPVPDAMRGRLWDQDWFEDPVWRKERLNAIAAHFITAFLDRYVKGDASRAGFLDVPVPESAVGVWPDPPPDLKWDAYSPGTAGITLWKGFQRRQATGLELLRAAAAAPTPAEAASATEGPLVLAKQGSFFLGGREQPSTTLGRAKFSAPPGTITVDQVYVRYQTPPGAETRPNVVLIHGCCLTGKTWETTPDGRMGWDEYFVRRGFSTYIVDQAWRGRSASGLSAINAVADARLPIDALPLLFSASQEVAWVLFRFGPRYGEAFPGLKFPVNAAGELWKQMVPDFAAGLPKPNPTVPALSQLLQRIGPTVLVGHSQSGIYPFQAAIARLGNSNHLPRPSRFVEAAFW
jgi:predicted dienelactone hydrolase